MTGKFTVGDGIAEGSSSSDNRAGSRKRVLAIASGGGHFVQLLRLRPAWEGHDVTYATVHATSAVEVTPARLLTFRDVSRADLWRLPLSLVDIVWILLKVRPQIVVTTGALPALLALAVAKLFGVETIWVDSIANSETLSGSGAQAARLSGRVLTQWPSLATPEVEYWGNVL